MTDLLADITAALPAVEIVVSERISDRVCFNDITGEFVIVAVCSGKHEPRPLVCEKHGAQRHDWNDKTKQYDCKVCNRRAPEKAG